MNDSRWRKDRAGQKILHAVDRADCSKRYTAKAIRNRPRGGCTSPNPTSRTSAPLAFPASVTGRFSARQRKCDRPSTSRIFCRAPLVVDLGWARIGASDNPRGDRRTQGELGGGGGYEESLWQFGPRMAPPIRAKSRWRSALDQPDPALAQSGHSVRWGITSELGWDTARRIDQRTSRGCPAGLGRATQTVGEVRSGPGAKQDQARRNWTLCPDAHAQAGTRPETIKILGFAPDCTRNQKGHFKVGRTMSKRS